MKKFRFLFLVPAIFAMVACNGLGKGKEIKAEKAKEIAQGMKDTKQPEDFEIYIEMTSYDAEEKTNSKSNYTLKQNAAGEFYAAMKSETTGGDRAYNMDVEAYKVKDDKYEEVIYMKSYDADEKKEEIDVYVKKGNETTYAYAEAQVGYEIGSLTVYLTSADELVAAIEAAEKESAANDNIEVKYYSNGADNLTIQEIAKETDDEKSQFGESSITFDKGLLTETTTKFENKAGDKIDMKITCKYPKSVKIDLPSGWESHIQAQ